MDMVSRSVAETEGIGEALGRAVRTLGGGICVCLRGGLGAGKTQMVRGMTRGAGADAGLVSSPTYVLLNVYPAGADGMTVSHLDAYRVGGEDDFEAVGFEELLAEGGLVHRVDAADGDGTWQWTSESYPADAVSLRSISSDNFVVVDTTRGADVIGETSFSSGPSTLHEKAIYLLEGGLYQVEKLDFDGRKAYVRQIDCDYYTDATRAKVAEVYAADLDAFGYTF